MKDEANNKVAIIGGTGPQGKGLALRLALAGVSVVLGSRDPAKAEETAKALVALLAEKDCQADITGFDGRRDQSCRGSGDFIGSL